MLESFIILPVVHIREQVNWRVRRKAVFSGGGDSAIGEISLNTSKQYNPSGRETLTIYGYANAGGLLGNGGFWEKTIADVDKNIQDAFGKRFK